MMCADDCCWGKLEDDPTGWETTCCKCQDSWWKFFRLGIVLISNQQGRGLICTWLFGERKSDDSRGRACCTKIPHESSHLLAAAICCSLTYEARNKTVPRSSESSMATPVPVAARVFHSDLGSLANRRTWRLSLSSCANWLFYLSMSNIFGNRAIEHLLPLRRRNTKTVRAILLTLPRGRVSNGVGSVKTRFSSGRDNQDTARLLNSIIPPQANSTFKS